MAKIRIASAAALALFAATAANAADIARPVYKAPVMVPVVYNWSGFYLGGFAGAAFGGDSSAVDLDGWNATGTQWSYGLGNSFIGGGTIGFNWQAPGSAWVFDLEGEFGYLQLKGRHVREHQDRQLVRLRWSPGRVRMGSHVTLCERRRRICR